MQTLQRSDDIWRDKLPRPYGPLCALRPLRLWDYTAAAHAPDRSNAITSPRPRPSACLAQLSQSILHIMPGWGQRNWISPGRHFDLRKGPAIKRRCTGRGTMGLERIVSWYLRRFVIIRLSSIEFHVYATALMVIRIKNKELFWCKIVLIV